MYRITEEIAHYLLDVSKSFDIPGIEKDTARPFVIKNRQAIGSINPLLVFGSDAMYLIESDEPESGLDGGTGVAGYWLYRNDELKIPDDTIEMPRSSVDRYTTNPDEIIDVADCSIELPSAVEKLLCKKIESLERLLELEPELKDCIDPEKEKTYEQHGHI